MDIESVRSFCLSLPHVDEKVQWGNDLLFRIGEKMFAVVALEPSHGVLLSFKCTPEKFAELVEQDGLYARLAELQFDVAGRLAAE